MATESPALYDAIDESNLTGETGEIYLFQWLAATERAVKRASVEDLKASQVDLEGSLVKIIQAPEPYPAPGRPVRALVAKCFIAIYTRGETKTIFDTIQSFLKVVGEPKAGYKDSSKLAATYCIGEIMGAFGSQVMSLMIDITNMSLKLYKASSAPVILRYHALRTLEKCLSTAKRAVTDSLLKDIVKQMRHALGDKALAIQRAACDVLILMYPADDPARLVADVDSLVVLCTKSLESADQLTRRSLAKLVAHLLAATQVERLTPVAEPPKKAKKGQNASEDEEDVPTGLHIQIEEAKPVMMPNEMLLQLSLQFNKPQASRKVRVGIFDFYTSLLSQLGPSFVESNYGLIVDHLMTEIIENPRNTTTRYETLLVRSLVEILLRDLVGVRMLSEQAQIMAIQELSNVYLKRWPAMMPGQTAPNPLCIVVALREVAKLLQQLGNAPPPVQDALIDPLSTLLGHPNHSIRVNAAWALRCFCYSTPLRLPKVLISVVEVLQRDISAITTPTAPSDIHTRSLGHAYGLAALLTVIPERPLYVSYDISAKVFDTAVQLLKRAGDHEVKIARTEVEIAWTCIAALMALGPNFVRAHLPQLLVLWRNALPKPTNKDASAGRTPAEWMFLLHLRESALGAVYCFLKSNSPTLVTPDVTRRIAFLLSNSLQFVNTFRARRIDENPEQLPTETKELSLEGREALLRTRIFQCFSLLGHAGITESMQSALLQSAISLFASPEGYAGSSVQAAIATSTGAFTSVWQSTDGYAYGVSDIHIDESVKAWMNRDNVEISVEEMFNKPIIRSCSNDPLFLCQRISSDISIQWPEPPPPATAAVNAAIQLFAQLLHVQDLQSTIRTVTQLMESTGSAKLARNSGRKAAVTINATIALVLALRQATAPRSRQSLGNGQVTSLLSNFLKDVLMDGDLLLRRGGSEAIGRLASIAGTNFLTAQAKTLVDQVVSNRDPHGRAGCALAFGEIHAHVGGLATGPLLKTTVHILMSLVNDPHPVVHFWSLIALARVIDAASLAYAPFVPSTLGLLFKVYMLESHEPEGGSLAHANLSGDLPAYQAVCQNIDAVITVLGPDMQDSTRSRTLVLDLVHQFISEDDDGICVEAINCIQHFLMFAPEFVAVPALVAQFRGYLSSTRRPLKLASINALYQLVQKDAFSMSRLGGDELVEELFAMLDDDSSVDGVRNVIDSWLQQTVVHNPSAWIDLCQRIMSRTTASQQANDAATKRGDLLDDEGQSLSMGANQDSASGAGGRQTSRWRTQLFALQCLHNICTIVGRSGRREHLDIAFARSQGLPVSGLLVSRVPDLIKIAFTASAAHVTEIRLEGLTVLRDVIEIFAKTPDPDYEDSLLLEQHQAPITAALTPAFSSDSTPEILASAIGSCAVFVGCGVSSRKVATHLYSSDVDISDQFGVGSGMLSLGDAAKLSPNASVMLRIATLSAWAELQVASADQKYLLEVVKPHRPTLAPLWVACLRDYASIRADTEVLEEPSSSSLDTSYASLGKEVLLPYYLEAWPVILQAVASVMKAGDPYILAAMDGQESITPDQVRKLESEVREEPTVFFFAIFGLVFEALATAVPDADVTSQKTSAIALEAMTPLVQGKYCGKVFNDPVIFDEVINLFYRMALTEPASVQIYLVEAIASLARSLASTHATSALFDNTSQEDLFNLPQVHCLRVCAYVIRRAITGPRSGAVLDDSTPMDKIGLINAAFEAFSNVADTFGQEQRDDFKAVAVTLYNEYLKDETSDIDLVGPTLQSLKALLELPAGAATYGNKYEKVIHGLLSACLVNIDEMRGRQGRISAKKIKSNLLAAVLVLTVVPPKVKISQAIIDHACFLISQKLVDEEEMSLTAAHCAKTLILASTSGNAALRQCARLLLPGMIECLAKIAASVGDQASERQLATVGEIYKGFAALFSSLQEDLRPRALGIIMPAMIFLLDPSRTPMSTIHSQTVTQLLSLASQSPSAFKEVTAKLDPQMRELLESSVRQVLGNQGPAVEAPKPQISLRTF
ncbi:clathrin-coated vesicle protein [Laetiporus sulphureus 93-53]|uniref:Clathrin-coated vesicle protein n=1 Tax=Laetiporus sulphureus 93-53 TaxID=1314785 RepID=A0A165DME3_9APHY|nr:clathrin-coated vesicle protein [Laetiporus sulphureus 93-53]KZT05196.1 clathrin-coated vesicle protein [Laetiporus sulphureus 93-53]